MNWKSCGLLGLILILAITWTSEAKGGRGGSGRSSGGSRSRGSGSRGGGGGGGGTSRGGGSGWFNNLFGGSSSSNYFPATIPKLETYSQTYNAYQHTPNYGNSFDSDYSRRSNQNYFMNGYLSGNILPHSPSSTIADHRLNNALDLIYPKSYTRPISSSSSRHEHTALSESSEDPFKATFEDLNNSLKEIHEMMTNTHSQHMATTYVETKRVEVTTIAPPESIRTNFTATVTNATVTPTELPPTRNRNFATSITEPLVAPSVEILPKFDSESSVSSKPESLAAVTESTLDTKPEISTPYGVICFPMVYNQTNEFGVNVVIEQVGCYPAPETVLPPE